VKIPVQLNFETEPDEYVAGRPPFEAKQPVTSIRYTYDFMDKFRPRMQELTKVPARFNWMWRLDSEFEQKCGTMTEIVAQHQDIIESIHRQGDEIGAHFHPLRWNEAAGEWEFPYSDQTWLQTQLRDGLKEFEQVMGFRAEAVRLSDNILLNEDMLDLMEDAGIKRDITIEPDIVGTHMVWKNVPREDTFHGFPLYPYQPERGNFRQPGQLNRRDIWMLLTSTNYVTKADPAAGPEIKHDYVALDLAFYPPSFAAILDRQLESLENPYLLIVGNSNTTTLPRLKDYFETNFDALLRHRLAPLFEFVTSAGLVEWVKGRDAAQPETDPLYQGWLRERNLARKQEIEDREQAYRKLELYTRSLEQHLAEKQRYIDSLEKPAGGGLTALVKTRLKGKTR
jgi:hypothetical protein